MTFDKNLRQFLELNKIALMLIPATLSLYYGKYIVHPPSPKELYFVIL